MFKDAGRERQKSAEGMDVEESQITRANPMKKPGVLVLIAATRVISWCGT